MQPCCATVTAGARLSVIWAITSYFNPVGYRRRLVNYRIFRERLGLPLVAVELRGRNGFELGSDDADILIRLTEGDMLWQKERLLNIALRALPADCDAVVWTDCDVIFEEDAWTQRAAALLDRFALVHPFQDAVYLPPEWQPGDPVPPAGARSVAAFVADGVPPADCVTHREPAGNGKPGLAWMARREILDRHGFYDACITGGGDSAFVAAAYGCCEVLADLFAMNAPWRRHYAAWGQGFHGSVAGRVATVPGRIYHLWHGARTNRQYLERHAGLVTFDPVVDVAARSDEAWRWNSDKPELHAFLRNYFSARREDDDTNPGSEITSGGAPSSFPSSDAAGARI
jgi:hypothetical protein